MKVEDSPTFLRLETVSKMTALSKSTIEREIEAGNFPPGYRVTSRSRRWLQSEVVAWIEAVLASKRK